MKLVHHNTGGNGESSHQIYFEDVINRHNLSGITGYGSTKEESIKDFEKKLEWLADEIKSILTLVKAGQYEVVEKEVDEKPEPPIYYRKPDILPAEKFYITRENFKELRSVYIENTIRALKYSSVYRAYAKYVGAWKLLIFPVPLYAVIEMVILERLDKVSDTCISPFYIANDIITGLVRNEIPYLRLTSESEERLLYSIMNMEETVNTGYYESLSPLIKERLVMGTDKIIQRAKDVYGEDILDSKFTTEELKFWSIYENLIKKQAERSV